VIVLDVSSVRNLEVDELRKALVDRALPVATHLVGAIALWVIGRWFINMIRRVIRVGAAKRLDPTLVRYLESATQFTLTGLLLLAILSIFGVETTSFAGIIAAAGVAVGMAWSGLLSNFAAGVFILALRPFRVGDQVTLAGVTGVVQEIGMFNTGIDTLDNVRTWVGNNKALSDNIQNFTVNGWRRVELKVPLPEGADVFDTMAKLVDRATKVPHVLKDPKPSATISSLDGHGTIVLQASTPPAVYGQVLDGLARTAAELLKEKRA
jgi:small conductance mechanosensitive channel